ncbi:hypothetical protein [Streptomyces sirii]|uniref:hypothetical protein n=1 Tax=Streptomyces sirii TaxID=3127701 RepID=UPI003D365C83
MQDGMVSSLRSDPRTSAAVSGSGWVGNSPQAEQLLTHLAPGERVELLFTTLRFHGALTSRRLLLWQGIFKVERMELRRPLPVLGSGSESRFGEAVVLDGPEGAIELKALSAAVSRALVAAGRQGDGNTPASVGSQERGTVREPSAHGRTPNSPPSTTCTPSASPMRR